MLWYVIVGLLTLLCVGLVWGDDRSHVSPIGALVGCAFWGGLVATFLNGILCNVESYKTVEMTRTVGYLENLSDGTETYGSGNLFFISIGTNGVYTYYIRNSDGSYSLHTKDAEDWQHPVKVWQDATTPRLDCRYTKLAQGHTSHWISVFGPSIDNGSCDSYAFHVPPGSIVHGYKLDG